MTESETDLRRARTEQSGGSGEWRYTLPMAVAIAAGFGALALVHLLARPLGLLILAITLAQAMSPLADRFERRMPRGAAAALLYGALIGIFLLLAWLVAPDIAQQAGSLAGEAPRVFDAMSNWLGRWTDMSGPELRQTLTDNVTGFQSTLMRLPVYAANFTFDVIVVLFLSLYLLIAGPRLKRFTVSLFPARKRRRAARVLARIGRAMGGYVRGIAIDAVIIGGLTWGALSLVGLPFAGALAVVAGLGEIVPYVGPIVAAIPAIAVALGQSPTDALIVAGIYVGLQQVEGQIVTPNVMKHQTDVNPALVIFAITAGFTVGGVLGAIVAVPLSAALRVLLLTTVAPVLRNR